MKKLFILLVVCVLSVSTTFAVKNCVFIVKTDATADQIIIDYLRANGYTVTIYVADGTVPAGNYDLAVISETNGSGDPVWKAFRNAPIPFIALKTFCAKASANSLTWLTTNVTGTDFANTSDVSVMTVAGTHPILAGIPNNPAFFSGSVTSGTLQVALQWINFPTLPSGATVITTVTIGSGTTYTLSGQLPQIIAFEKNTAINTATLTNRAVMAGFNYLANANLTANALKAIKQSCDWVVAGNTTGIHTVVPTNLLNKMGDQLVNPDNLDVAIYNIMGVRILSTKETAINVSGLSKGVYIAKTKAGVLKFAL